MKKIISIVLCLITALSICTTAVSASNEGIAPCLNNTSSTMTVFTVEDGEAGVTVSYSGYVGLCTGATITSKIQKKFLLFFWKDVDIGMPNNEWVDEVSGDFYQDYHSVMVTDKGTYRAVVTYVIRGTGGSDDVLTDEIEYEYK